MKCMLVWKIFNICRGTSKSLKSLDLSLMAPSCLKEGHNKNKYTIIEFNLRLQTNPRCNM